MEETRGHFWIVVCESPGAAGFARFVDYNRDDTVTTAIPRDSVIQIMVKNPRKMAMKPLLRHPSDKILNALAVIQPNPHYY